MRILAAVLVLIALNGCGKDEADLTVQAIADPFGGPYMIAILHNKGEETAWNVRLLGVKLVTEWTQGGAYDCVEEPFSTGTPIDALEPGAREFLPMYLNVERCGLPPKIEASWD